MVKTRKEETLLRMIILLFAASVLFACDGGGGGGNSISSSTGTVSVGLTDNSTYKYKAVYITIKEVQFNRKDPSDSGNNGWEVFATPNKTYNLLRLVNGVSETLGDEEFPVQETITRENRILMVTI